MKRYLIVTILTGGLALGACSVDEATTGPDAPDVATEALADDRIGDSELNEWAFQTIWDTLDQDDRAVLCDAGNLLGWDEAGNQISIGADRQISATQAANLLRDRCVEEGL